jgi:L-threonylcarbamoyladenylate synthase
MSLPPASPDIGLDIENAAQRLLNGDLVAFPTETVYGLGADAENPAAIARIYAAKGRPANHPVIVHIAPGADIGYWAAQVPPEAQALIQAFWPGPLTLILARAAHIPPTVSGGQDSIGLRCPSHPVAQALLRKFARLKPGGQGGVAAPSANKFGHVSPTQAAHVRSEFPELCQEGMPVLEGGSSQVGIESTIIDLSRLDQGLRPVLLRPGHVTAAQIAEVLGMEPARPDTAAPRVSGSLKAHYAPHTPLSVATMPDLLGAVAQSSARAERVAAVVFDALPPNALQDVEWCIVASRPDAYARNLYALLRRLDQQGYARIFLEQPPGTAEWQAVNDRIGRAAAAFL